MYRADLFSDSEVETGRHTNTQTMVISSVYFLPCKEGKLAKVWLVEYMNKRNCFCIEAHKWKTGGKGPVLPTFDFRHSK